MAFFTEEDPYESLSNPTAQARRLMDERGIRRRGSDDFGARSTLAASQMAQSTFVDEQRKRISSLENELADTKKLLMDVMYDKQQLEKEKGDLQRLVEELSGGGTTGAVNVSASRDDPVADRAKSTILSLRLKRIEQKRAQFVDFVKTQGRTAQTATRRVRSTVSDLRSEIQNRFGAVQEYLTDSVSDFEAIVDMMNRKSYGLGEADGSMRSPTDGGGDYVNMVAAAVQQQQRHIVLAADHPLIQKLGDLYTGIDLVVETLNENWRDMRCFDGGKPPQITRPRRYIDTMANVQNYITQMMKVRRAAGYAHRTQRLFVDLRLPLAMRQSHSLVQRADDALTERIEALFDAMRAIRTSVVVKKRNLMTAMRIFAACESVQSHAGKIFTQYLKYSKAHTIRMLMYMASLVRFSKFRTADFALINEDTNAKSVGTCQMCECDVFCEDCHRIAATTSDAVREAYEQHRRLVRDFTIARLNHFTRLTKLINEAIDVLTQARLVPLETAAGRAAVEKALDEMIRKPQPPTSVNYFTRLRKADENRRRVAQGENPDKTSKGLAVEPLTLEQKRDQLVAMLAALDLHHLPPDQFPPDEVDWMRSFGPSLSELTSAGRGGGEDLFAPPRDMEEAITTPRGHSPRVPSLAPLSNGPSRLGTAATTSRSRMPMPRPPTRDDTFGRARTARQLEDHLPHLMGARSADAAAKHQERLDIVRKFQASQAGRDAPKSRGGGGPGSPRYGSDARHGFSTTRQPRTLTERILGSS